MNFKKKTTIPSATKPNRAISLSENNCVFSMLVVNPECVMLGYQLDKDILEFTTPLL